MGSLALARRMLVRNKDEVPTERKEELGLVSDILLQAGDVPSDELVVSWVEVEPVGEHASHSHDLEQVYVLVRGSGTMHVGD
jgi:mannose-6-phosphate isomerase-like protein (cupin superfamily)